jgi:glutamyl-tRNA reductase
MLYNLSKFSVIGTKDSALRALLPDVFQTTKTVAEVYMYGKKLGLQHFFVLNTCNRLEIYSFEESNNAIFNFLNCKKKKEQQEFYQYQGINAAKHLFAVASGIDSKLIGDYEISGQVVKAVQEAKQQQCLNTAIEYISNAALRASKDIKTQTDICKGYVSYASAAVQQVQSTHTSLKNIPILVYGLGEIGVNLLHYLLQYTDADTVTVANRTLDAAAQIALRHGLKVITIDNLPQAYETHQILFVCTGANQYTVTKNDLANSQIRQVYDLAQPNNADPSIAELSDIQLFNLKYLTHIFNQNMESRHNEVPKATAIIDQHLLELIAYFKNRHKIGLVKSFKKGYDDHQANTKNSPTQPSPKERASYDDQQANTKTDVACPMQDQFVADFMKKMAFQAKNNQDNACQMMCIMNEILSPTSVG